MGCLSVLAFFTCPLFFICSLFQAYWKHWPEAWYYLALSVVMAVISLLLALASVDLD